MLALMYNVFVVNGKIGNVQMNSLLAQVCKSVKVLHFRKKWLIPMLYRYGFVLGNGQK